MKSLSIKNTLSASHTGKYFCGLFILAFIAPNLLMAQEPESVFPPSIDPNRDGVPGIEMVQNALNTVVAGQRPENTGPDTFTTSEGDVTYQTISDRQQVLLADAYNQLGGAGTEGSESPVPNAENQVLIGDATPEQFQEAVLIAVRLHPEFAVAILEDLFRYIGPKYLTGPLGLDFISRALNGALEGNPGAAFALSNFVTSSGFLALLGGQISPAIAGLITDFTASATLVAQSNVATKVFGPGNQPGSDSASFPFNVIINNEDPDESPVTPIQNL